MMTFIATRYEDDGEYSESFGAESPEMGEEICKAMGWLLDGELVHSGVYDVNCHMAPCSIQ